MKHHSTENFVAASVRTAFLRRLPFLVIAFILASCSMLSGCATPAGTPVEFSFKPDRLDLKGFDTLCPASLKGPLPEDVQSDFHFVEYFNREIIRPYAACRDNHNGAIKTLRDHGYIK